MNVNIHDETNPLKEVLVWGEPGIESLLAQLLPKSKSLFRSYYEVAQARIEFKRMQDLIADEGIKVIRAKDVEAHALEHKVIPSAPGNIKELKKALHTKAHAYLQTYQFVKSAELKEEGFHFNANDLYEQIMDGMEEILTEDIKAYGEKGAIRLNYVLSLSKAWPMSNIFYGRDQSQVIENHVVMSSLKWAIRKPEVRIYQDALIELGLAETIVTLQEGTLEGGDLAMFKGHCLIGVGARTSLNAAINLYKQIGDELDQSGIKLMAIINKRQEEESHFFMSPTGEHMQVMHLDMFWSALKDDMVMGYPNEMDTREALWITRENGKIVTKSMGSFRNFLEGLEVEILEVTEEEQRNFATNFLNLGNNKIIAALSSNPRVNSELQKRGFSILYAELTKLVDGYGAVHCLTAPIKRS